MQQGTASAGPNPEARDVISKVSRRLLPFLLLMYVLAFLDRANIGFAKESLEADVGIGAAAYGLGAGIFFIGYAFFEVPSNLILHRVGARVWMCRIMVTWGLIAAAMMFVTGPISFYVLRFLLGVAEAGFFPGVILYLTYWYPDRFRGAATGLFYWGAPIAFIVGGPLSGALLELDGVANLQGWQYMFVVQGLAASAVGVWSFFYLDDKPADAAWLSQDERSALQGWVSEEEQVREQRNHLSSLAALANPRVLYFALIYFCIQLSVYGVTFWLPTTVGNIGGLSSWQVGLISAIPWICAAVGVYFVSRASDRTGDRKRLAAACMGVAALGIALSAVLSPVLAVAALCLGAFGFIAVQPLFWTLPTNYLAGAAAAGGIALVNAIGSLGGFAAPYFFGVVEESTGSIRLGLYTLAITTLVGGVLILFAKHRSSATTPEPSAQSGRGGASPGIPGS